jgi:hypothetical protein
VEQEPELIRARECDFSGAVRALRELLEVRVGVDVLSAVSATPVVTLTGALERVLEIGDAAHAAFSIEVDEALIRIPDRILELAICEEYSDQSRTLRWRVVALHLRSGVSIEVEEIPSRRLRAV